VGWMVRSNLVGAGITAMHIISRKALRAFTKRHPDAKTALDSWYQTAKRAVWSNFAAVRADFPHADPVGTCLVFNIGGNKYRLITKIHYAKGRFQGEVLIRFVLTHKEYDAGQWKDDCR
jgi:mRNA interferase HigB